MQLFNRMPLQTWAFEYNLAMSKYRRFFISPNITHVVTDAAFISFNVVAMHEPEAFTNAYLDFLCGLAKRTVTMSTLNVYIPYTTKHVKSILPTEDGRT